VGNEDDVEELAAAVEAQARARALALKMSEADIIRVLEEVTGIIVMSD
jgi:hypothetical protein